jgi:tetratricopeptide (TPR) repeat protein
LFRQRNLKIITVVLVLLAGFLWSQRLGDQALLKIKADIKDSTTEQLELVRNKVETKTDPVEIFDFGRKFLDSENPDFAVVAFEKSTKLQPEFRDGWYLLGLSYARQGEIEKAKTALNKALAIDPAHQLSLDLLKQLP